MNDVLVLSPSFGRWSPAPARLLEEAGLTIRRVDAPAPLTSEQIREVLPGTRAVVVGLDHMDRNAIDAGTDLRVIAKHGVGVDNIDLMAAEEAGISVVNTPALNSGAVADLVVGLLIGLLRRIPDAERGIRERQWPVLAGPELGELTVGIAGFGRVGQAVARRLYGFGPRIVAFDPYLPGNAFGEVNRAENFDSLLRSSDVVTLHLPGGQGAMIDAATLTRMRPGSYLINAARGDLVDESAVAAALAREHLAGYAADVFRAEPPTDSPLLDAPRTLLTPHIAAFTSATNERMGSSIAYSIIAALAGEELEHRVSPPHS